MKRRAEDPQGDEEWERCKYPWKKREHGRWQNVERHQEPQDHQQQEEEQQALPLQQPQEQQLQRDMVKTIAESALLQDKVLTLQRDMANALEEFAQNAANLLTSSSQRLHDVTSQTCTLMQHMMQLQLHLVNQHQTLLHVSLQGHRQPLPPLPLSTGQMRQVGPMRADMDPSA